MDLKEFISKTISDIIDGLDSASKELKGKKRKVGLYSTGKDNRRHIEFDVAVIASNKKGKKKDFGGEIKVWGILAGGAKAQIASEDSNSSVSRIKFGVRIIDIKDQK